MVRPRPLKKEILYLYMVVEVGETLVVLEIT